ncbi:MAG: RagB/SusD family nutrient uptake outer membrane protein, partial [Fermentimonas sp.]|nr:RagB/SusD family nutrient uptake outer membrane protein [Fermentimonas sp.]
KNLTSDKDALLKEILREKSCELGMEDSRFFDMIRYKMEDQFEKQLHRLKITRTDGGGQWFGKEKDSGAPWPEFTYERLPITSPKRVWWTEGFDPKWYLSPFQLGELNKGYGIVQNPGW